MRDGRQRDSLEAVALARFGQQCEVAGAPGAKAEVVTDDQPFHMQALDQHVADEVLRGQRRKARIEVLDDHSVDTGCLQRSQLVAQTGDAPWRTALITGHVRKEFTRMRLEGHHRGLHAQIRRGLADARQQRSMAEVHAIKIADRERARAARFGVGESAKNLHR